MLVPRKVRPRRKTLSPPMFLALGTRAGQPVNATSLACPKKLTLLYVSDRSSGTRFQLDTGAEISVVPPNMATRKEKEQSQRQQAANGEVSLSMVYGLVLRRTFRWTFTVEAVAIPLLGADFSRDNGLLVD